MAGIHIFAFLVGCAPNLLVCEQIPTDARQWAAMPDCQAALGRLMRQHSGNGYPVVMAKCHYAMESKSATEWRLAGRAEGRFSGF